MTAAAQLVPLRQGSDDWRAWRHGGFGASDAPTLVLGDHDAWRTLMAIKLGILPDPEATEPMEVGLEAEDFIARRYTKKTGQAVAKVRPMVHPELPHVRASLDRRRRAGRVAVELKFWSFPSDDFGPDGSDLVPDRFTWQGQQQLAVSGYDRIDFAVFFGATKELRVFHQGRDASSIDALLELENAAWAYIARGEMPPWPGPAPTRLRIRDGELSADADLEQLIVDGHMARLAKQATEKRDKELTAQILERLGEYPIARGSSVDVVAKPNRDGLKVEHALIAAAYRKALEEVAALSPIARATWTPPGLDAIAATFTTTQQGARPVRYVEKKES